MFAVPAKTLDAILQGNSANKDDVEMLKKMHKNIRDFYLKHLNAIPTREVMLKALDTLADSLEIRLSIEELEKILTLFPTTRIELACNGVDDTSVSDLLKEAVFIFVTGCELPEYKDNLESDSEQILAYFHLQAKEMRLGSVLRNV